TSMKGFFYGGMAAEDFMANGRTDVLMTGNSSFAGPEIRLYLKSSTGQFFIASGLTVPALQLSSLTALDINNDGLKDLLICGQDAKGKVIVKLYQNKGCF